MKREKLQNLLNAVGAELRKAEVHYKENKVASDQMQRTTATSWSSAGDREYAKDQEEVTKMNLDLLRALSEELKMAVEKDLPDKVVPPCFVRVHTGDEDVEFYLVKNIASVEGFTIVSVNSPVGEKINKKEKYEEYEITNNTGKIIGIE